MQTAVFIILFISLSAAAINEHCRVPIDGELMSNVPIGYIWTYSVDDGSCLTCECRAPNSFVCRPLRCLYTACKDGFPPSQGKCCKSCEKGESCRIGEQNYTVQTFEHMSFIRYNECGEQCVCMNGNVVCYRDFCWTKLVMRGSGLLLVFLLSFGITVAIGRIVAFFFFPGTRSHHSPTCCEDCSCDCCTDGTCDGTRHQNYSSYNEKLGVETHPTPTCCEDFDCDCCTDGFCTGACHQNYPSYNAKNTDFYAEKAPMPDFYVEVIPTADANQEKVHKQNI